MANWVNSACVYRIINIYNGKFYVGSAYDINKRLYRHLYMLINKKHENGYLQNSWNKYGENCFCIEILDVCSKETVRLYEQYWLDILEPFNRDVGYNISKNSTAPMDGRKHTSEALAKISAASIINQTGVPKTAEARRNMSIAKIGKICVGKNQAGNGNIKSKEYIVTNINSGETIYVKGISKFCREHGLNQSSMCKIARGLVKNKIHRGYTCSLLGREGSTSGG